MNNDSCLCIDLRTAANRLTQVYDEAMAPAGISVTQFSQLYLISTLNNPTLSELAAASQLERSTMGRNIRVLEQMKLVDMQVGKDARTRTIRLTRKGINSFKKALPLWQGMQSQLLARLGMSGKAQLNDLLNTLTTPASAASVTSEALEA